MSIRFNHASNTVTGTDVITLVVEGGSPSSPRPLRINSSSVVMPNKQLPVGESGAVVFDMNSKTLKYHNGIQWVELLSQDDILAPIQISLTDIYNQLANRVSTVTYSTSNIPTASVIGTNLNIVFPTSGGGGSTAIPGLFTSSPPGSIMQYSLISGQSVSSIREQLSGESGGQAGRDGSSSSPFVTKTGWCFGDGLYWTWNGEGGSITKLVPNLNQNAYLKGITTTGITKTDATIAGSGSISSTSITAPQHYHGTGMMLGLSGQVADDAMFISNRVWNDGIQYQGVQITGDVQSRVVGNVNGSDSRTALSTTLAIYTGSDTTSHTHTLTNNDVAHFNVAMVYNIAEPSLALNQTAGDARYVLKAGDIMTGSLTIANSATISTNDTSNILWFRNAAGLERAAIYHNSTTNTLRLRSNGGNEVTINQVGNLTAPTLTVTGVAATGPLTVTGRIVASDDIWAFSDIRLKENMIPIDSALDKLEKITGYIGNMIGEDTKRSMVSAQELQQVLPEAVSTKDEYLTVNYSAIIPLLIQSINELREEVRSKK
ncbi:Long tail fiber protein p37 [Yersinia phage fHe-Yen9-04]|uniref:Long tail fiber protein p37 n=2 Tax=Eneladusvirus Yen904 TaxID=2560849 RepID=A0A2C9CXI4_9CAUD|nr:tail fiber protein [Yersinia phage fHe-Yen9-04]SOK58530.1 Long tail fiber protein p37 [Yersinia phage fHe-Yen9-04]SOK59064.1 Long tail fiber protein p37 [Yersinia phage fHe-Yen9-03]VUE36299.1 Long tail fiber protein p37 [Yersinia phage fHe-Yen9-04]